MSAPALQTGPQQAVVIDDSASAVTMMTQLLETLDNCRPKGFTQSSEALAWCLENEVDLVIVDYEMPSPNGIAVIERLRDVQSMAAVPIVMVTSTEDREVRYMALQVGATDFLTKPIDPVEFTARMQNLLTACRAHKTLAELSNWLTAEVRKVSMVVRQSPVSVVITNLDGEVEYVNPRFVETTGFTQEDVIGQRIGFLKEELSPPGQIEELHSAINGGREWRGTIENRRRDGTPYWETAVIFPIRDSAGTIMNYVAIKEDITQRREYEARLDWYANYDTLTRLPNRTLLQDRLKQTLALAAHASRKAAVLQVELLRFKTINETIGHDAGDDVLRQAACRLLAIVGEPDTVARVGDAEFAIVMTDAETAKSPQTVAEEICDSLGQFFEVGETEVALGASIGIAVFPDDGATAHELLRNAASARPGQETEGRGAWRFFTPEREINARQRLKLETALRHALSRAEFTLHYHPLVEVVSGRVPAAEALLRWYQPDLGWVSPNQFIPIAEENGLIVPIGAWVVETVCRDMARWRAQGLRPIRIAINVSSQQLNDHQLADVIGRSLAEHKISPEWLELEVTERLLLDQSPLTSGILEALRAMGLRFAIDDFGTGYSSMSYLTSFPFDVLKVDRSFVARVTSSRQDAALTQAVIAMAHALELEVVAEGVETQEQLDFLQKVACNFAQGYFFSRPVGADEFAEILGRPNGYHRP